MSGRVLRHVTAGCPAQEAFFKSALKGVNAKVIFLPGTFSRSPALRAERFGPSGAVPQEEKKIRLVRRRGMHSGVAGRGVPARFLLRRKGGVPADFSGDADIARDPIGIIWMAPIVPFRREDLALVNGEMDASSRASTSTAT